ncbi:MAG: amidohydrolase family protein [Dehalococcoidia bacterium]
MARQYKVISGDGHIDLNPDIWRDRVAAKWRDRAAKRVTIPSGMDAVEVDGKHPHTIGITRNVGFGKTDDLAEKVPTFDNGSGSGTPKQRLREQDQDGIDAEILYSQLNDVLRDASDDGLYVDMVRAYNEFLAEEYQPAAPDRLVPIGLIPTNGVDDAVKELEHCAAIGLRGVKLDAFPSGQGHPTPEDDRFWAAAVDMRMPLTSHSDGLLSTDRRAPAFVYEKEPGTDLVHQGDPFTYFFRFTSNSMKATTQMAFAGVWDRFPTLELYWAETMIGWLEYGLWQIDDHYDRYMDMIHANWGLKRLERMPSEYIKERTYWGFLHDPIGVEHRDSIGVDKLIWGTDFAHAASDWPNSVKVMEQDFAGVPEDEKRMMLVDNAVRYFHLD